MVDTKAAGGQGHLEVTLVIVVVVVVFFSIQPSNFLPSCVCVCVLLVKPQPESGAV